MWVVPRIESYDKTTKVVQLVPADGWYAVFGDRAEDPVIFWALTDDNQIWGLIFNFDKTILRPAEHSGAPIGRFNGYRKVG